MSVKVKYNAKTKNFEFTIPVIGRDDPMRIQMTCFATVDLIRELQREVREFNLGPFRKERRTHLKIIKGGDA